MNARTAAKRIDRVAAAAVGAITLLMALVAGRVVMLQAQPGDRLAASVEARQTRRPLPPVRGNILDRRGRLLATTEFGHRVFVDPVEFPSPPDEAIALLADALGARPEAVGSMIMAKLAENEARS